MCQRTGVTGSSCHKVMCPSSPRSRAAPVHFKEKSITWQPPSISASISYSIYHWGLLWPASCDAVIISEYISVELYNAFTSLILKALCVIETVSHRLLTKSPARHGLSGRLGENVNVNVNRIYLHGQSRIDFKVRGWMKRQHLSSFMSIDFGLLSFLILARCPWEWNPITWNNSYSSEMVPEI